MQITPHHVVQAHGKERKLFLVRGRMRSGTNWVGSLLNLHPEVNCRGEIQFHRLCSGLKDFREMRNLDFDGSRLRGVVDAGVREMVRACIASLVELKPGATWHGDRTPERLTDAYGEYPTIYIVRDGRDALVSWLFHTLSSIAEHPDPKFDELRGEFRQSPQAFVADPARIFELKESTKWGITGWREHVRADLETLAAWRSNGRAQQALYLRYEDLHADVEGWRRKLYDFLGVDPALAAPVSTKSNTAPGFGRAEQAGAFHRSGQVGDWRKYFTPEVKRLFKDEAGELLVQLGYEKDQDW